MTREEIKNTPEVVDCLLDRCVLIDSRATLRKRLEEVCEMAIKALEQEDILDKIRAEIQGLRNCSCSCSDGIIDDVEDIIDKYMEESEDKE